MHIKVFLVFSLISYSFHLSGQPGTDPTDNGRGQEIVQAVFDSYFPDHHAKKIRGRAYFNPYLSAPEHQFFKSKTSLEGILYTVDDTIHCKDVFYDLHRDKLLVYVPELYSMVEMDEAFIERFTLREKAVGQLYTFVKLGSGGFYQQIYAGDAFALYKKHGKFYRQKAKQGRYYDGFDKVEQLIFCSDSSHIPIRKNKDLLALFPEDKAALKKYLRRSRIQLRGASDENAQALMKHLEEMYTQQNPDKSGD